jgi:peptide-methionine (S)-S-oxide reductase
MKEEKATLGGGCFWCLEAVFKRVKGVEAVHSGYSGGRSEKPTYQEVSSGESGHAEVVQLTYDADVVTFGELLDIFWKIHDPTNLNRQGADTGTQYRSVIFYHDAAQEKTARDAIAALGQELPRPVVTELAPLEAFWPAEAYHREYYDTHRREGYCMLVIDPKIEKVKKSFGPLLKKD